MISTFMKQDGNLRCISNFLLNMCIDPDGFIKGRCLSLSQSDVYVLSHPGHSRVSQKYQDFF